MDQSLTAQSTCLFNLQVETMKKSYHSACKEEKLAASRETNSKLESNNNPEAQKKLQEKVEKCQQEVQKVGLPVLKTYCGDIPVTNIYFLSNKCFFLESIR